MIWKQEAVPSKLGTQCELPDGRPALDEIVADGAVVHLEQISHEHWWMGQEAGGQWEGNQRKVAAV
jgi:hypothetical protein